VKHIINIFCWQGKDVEEKMKTKEGEGYWCEGTGWHHFEQGG
jgi:hypothetical protein